MNLDDIEVKELTIWKDERGFLFEGLRADDPLYGGVFGQCLVSVVNPGVIKGLHLHHQQTDFTLCARGRVLYVATDGENVRKFLLDTERPRLIKVPPGIWHGYQARGGEAMLIHIMDKTYDPNDTEAKDPFEFGRLWNLEGADTEERDPQELGHWNTEGAE
ncbi:MAG: dTDP-4-dehydrorhamnose 3,5-epimerase family protein [Nanoarchaeota archaeon]|nr:dTDP-4-dehydrorhamnose 3,5-epimerase family protein [Nanoarchaeota archaeon]